MTPSGLGLPAAPAVMRAAPATGAAASTSAGIAFELPAGAHDEAAGSKPQAGWPGHSKSAASLRTENPAEAAPAPSGLSDWISATLGLASNPAVTSSGFVPEIQQAGDGSAHAGHPTCRADAVGATKGPACQPDAALNSRPAAQADPAADSTAVEADDSVDAGGSAADQPGRMQTTHDFLSLVSQAVAQTSSAAVHAAEPGDSPAALLSALAQSCAPPVSTVGDSALPATPSPAATLSMTQTDWPQDLASQVQMQLDEGLQELHIELHPADLGGIRVQLRLTGDDAEVHFSADHPQTRAALEAAMPQLRRMLGVDGVALVQASVGAQPLSANGLAAAPADDAAAVGPALSVQRRTRVTRLRLVDDFA